MINYNINITPAFEEELEKIIFYIHYVLKEPNIALKLYRKIMNKILSLNISPKQYSKIYHPNSDIRKLPINNYVVIYTINNTTRRNIPFTYISLYTKLFRFNII